MPKVEVGDLRLPGDIEGVAGASGLVVFAHGSGSSHASPRNRAVADSLNRSGLATLLFDLLTASEAGDRSLVFDIGLLAGRLADATSWVRGEPACGSLPIGYFGASTGSAAALTAASRFGEDIAAVVSRGGRPDLAGGLDRVTAPTLLIVGGADTSVLELNRLAERELRCTHRLEVVPGASHLFEEPGAMDRVTSLAEAWFEEHVHR